MVAEVGTKYGALLKNNFSYQPKKPPLIDYNLESFKEKVSHTKKEKKGVEKVNVE